MNLRYASQPHKLDKRFTQHGMKNPEKTFLKYTACQAGQVQRETVWSDGKNLLCLISQNQLFQSCQTFDRLIKTAKTSQFLCKSKNQKYFLCVYCVSRRFAGTHPGAEAWWPAVGGRHFHLAPPSLCLLVSEPDCWGGPAVRWGAGPVSGGRALPGQGGAAASASALLLLVLNGRLESYIHTHTQSVYCQMCWWYSDSQPFTGTRTWSGCYS